MSSVTPYTSYLHCELFQQDLLRSLISFSLHRLVVQLVVTELQRVDLVLLLTPHFRAAVIGQYSTAVRGSNFTPLARSNKTILLQPTISVHFEASH